MESDSARSSGLSWILSPLMMRSTAPRRRRLSVLGLLLCCTILTFYTLLLLSLTAVVPSPELSFPGTLLETSLPVASPEIPTEDVQSANSTSPTKGSAEIQRRKMQKELPCATVEEMGEAFGHVSWKESLKVRRLIRDHFALHGASRVRELPPEQFCKQGFVIGKASQAGFGNEMYKILTSAALSIMGKYPFQNYISYTDLSFTMNEVKHLWRRNDCVGKYGRHLVMRTDDFEKPTETNVLCSNWRKWKQPIIWFKGTTDAVAAQFFLKNIHPQMRKAASTLFGKPGYLQSRPNTFGELMRAIISPSENVQEAVNWTLRGDTPSLIKDITPKLKEFSEWKNFKGKVNDLRQSEFRVKDWGSAPRWVAFVDFFLASLAKHAVVSGAQRRVGTTYAQLIAALAAAHQLEENDATASKFSFFSSFQSPLSCPSQPKQCALTPLLAPAWWDGNLQSPIPRDIRRLEQYGVKLSSFGIVDEKRLHSFCKSRKTIVKTIQVTQQ
ncbi:hypothetical protein CK203_068797 [Vitis vinifera]|uniref:Uncharacterized protein n=1 Tax=Vitis vinifera TaxID=29760 RepID=A0A438EY91_VITVI|nr:hypothetical protein CK203_068797 [Vitis vinifera]